MSSKPYCDALLSVSSNASITCLCVPLFLYSYKHTYTHSVLQALLRHVDFSIVKCLIIAGPGFAKDTFKEYLEAEAVRRDLRFDLDCVCVCAHACACACVKGVGC